MKKSLLMNLPANRLSPQRMSIKPLAVLLSMSFLFGTVYAADFVDTARVVSSTPVYERINTPRRECWTETAQSTPKERSMGGAVVGGLAGGLLGSQVGGGHGSTVATGAGAVAGAVMGDRVANPDSNRSATGSIVGGIAGALLGSQVGGGSGNKAATAAGGLAGVLIGDRVANPDQPRSEQVERCRDVDNYRDVIKGYTVTFRYNGQDATTTLPYDPGSTVKVGISLIQDQTRSGRDQNYQDRRYRSGERN